MKIHPSLRPRRLLIDHGPTVIIFALGILIGAWLAC